MQTLSTDFMTMRTQVICIITLVMFPLVDILALIFAHIVTIV